MKNVKTAKFIPFVSIALILCLMLALSSYAANGTGALTVESKNSNVSFSIYQVATPKAEGGYTPTAKYASCDVSWTPVKNSEWLELAKKLADATKSGNIAPTASATTDDTKKVAFSGLDAGMYLVVGDNYIDGDNKITPVPFLVIIEDGKTAVCVVKNDEEPYKPDPPKPPKTGYSEKLGIYAGLSLISAATLILLLIAVRKRRREEKA